MHLRVALVPCACFLPVPHLLIFWSAVYASLLHIWQWHKLGHMQVCNSLQTDNHASTPPLSFLQAGCPSCRPTNSVKALQAPASLSVLYVRSTLGITELLFECMDYAYLLYYVCCGILLNSVALLIPLLFAYGPANATTIPKPHNFFPHFSPNWTGFTFLVPVYPGCPGRESDIWL